MKPWMLATLIGAGLAISGDVQAQAKRKLATEKGWLDSLEKGKAIARQSGKPLMVVFRCEP